MPSSQRGNNQTWADSRRGRSATQRREDQAQACIEQGDQRAHQRFACSPRAAGQGLSWFKRSNRLTRLRASKIMLTLEYWLLEKLLTVCTALISAAVKTQPGAAPEALVVCHRPRRLRPNVHSGVEPDVLSRLICRAADGASGQ